MPKVLLMETAYPPVDGGTVLITGASSGIGRELAIRFATRASTLVLAARRAGRLEELRASLLAAHPKLNVVAVAADLSDPAGVEGLVAQVQELAGPVDILVNNAGVGDQELFDQAQWPAPGPGWPGRGTAVSHHRRVRVLCGHAHPRPGDCSG